VARHWRVVLAVLTLAVGSALAAGVASASSAPAAARAGAISPGHTMIMSGAPGAGAARSGASSGARNVVKSSNWSGYAAHLPRKGVYHSVSASWVQPRARCGKSAGTQQFAAFWVGLDGFNVNSKSVEQTGTDSDCNGTTPHYYGWFEMFPKAPVFFKSPLQPGDHISASVTFSGVEKYTLVLTDATRHWTHTIVRRVANLARSSAEVITEAPSSNTGVLPLANFGTVRFSLIRVNGTLLSKQTPSRIIIVNASNQPEDATSVIGNAGGAFQVTWIRSS
jgi:Peptidase A4 family